MVTGGLSHTDLIRCVREEEEGEEEEEEEDARFATNPEVDLRCSRSWCRHALLHTLQPPNLHAEVILLLVRNLKLSNCTSLPLAILSCLKQPRHGVRCCYTRAGRLQ